MQFNIENQAGGSGPWVCTFRRIVLDPVPGSGSFVPEPLPAAECIGILAEAHALSEFLEQFRIASAWCAT